MVKCFYIIIINLVLIHLLYIEIMFKKLLKIAQSYVVQQTNYFNSTFFLHSSIFKHIVEEFIFCIYIVRASQNLFSNIRATSFYTCVISHAYHVLY